MQQVKGIISFILLLIILCDCKLRAATYYFTSTTGTAALNSTANWRSNPNGTGSQPSNFTTNGDVFNVVNGASGIVNANWTLGAANGAGRKVTLNIEGTVTINAGRTVTVTGKNANSSEVNVTGIIIFESTAILNLAVNNAACYFGLADGAKMITANTTGVSGVNCSVRQAGANCTVSLSTNADYEFNGVAQAMTGIPSTVRFLTLSGSGSKTWSNITTVTGDLIVAGTAFTTTANTVTVSGNLIIGDGATFTAGGYDLAVAGTTTIGAGSGGTFNINSAAGTKIFSGLVTINGSANWNNSADSPVYFGGGITTVPTFAGGQGMHFFVNSNQTLTGNFEIPNLSVDNIIVTNHDSLDVLMALAGTGAIEQAVNAVLTIGGDCTIANLNAIATGNTVDFNGLGNQLIPGFTYYHLVVSNSGVKSILPGVVINCQTIHIEDDASIDINTDGGAKLNVLED